MKSYLQSNLDYWAKGYAAQNVESQVFRVYGRILKPDFGLSGQKSERVLDFGCGEGATLRFLKQQGFSVFGVDISVDKVLAFLQRSEADIARCAASMPDVAPNFQVIEPQPRADDVFFGGNFDLVTAIQALYYYSDEDMETRLQSLHAQMRPGAVIYATMMGTKMWYYQHSTEAGDGLRNVSFETERLKVKDYFVNFTRDEEDLKRKFHLFRPVHMGYYDAHYRADEGSDFHYTFVGVRD